MLRNYLKIAFRNLWKNRIFSLINISGLALGLSAGMFIAYYVWHEFHYDRFHPHSERTYRILQASKFGDSRIFITNLPAAFGPGLKRQVPEVAAFTRIWNVWGEKVLRSDYEHRFNEKDIAFVDPAFTELFGFRFSQGNPRTALTRPGSIVLTETLACNYFGEENPVGKTIVYDKKTPLTVTGVVADPPSNTVIRFSALISFATIPTLGPNEKVIYEKGGFADTYLLLRDAAAVTAAEKKLKAVSDGMPFKIDRAEYFLEALPNLHLYSRTDATGSARQYLYIFMAVALVVLLLAVTNYISLTTARATKRAKEVGVRKVVGGRRRELMAQFYTESTLMTLLAFLLALLLFRTFLPLLSEGLDLSMDESLLADRRFWLCVTALWLAGAALAGSYPALLLSRFAPQQVLKGVMSAGRNGALIRRVFTVFQFSASVGLLICTLVLTGQLDFLRNKNLGIRKDQVMAVKIDASMGNRLAAFRDEVVQQVGPGNVALSNTALFTTGMATYFVQVKDSPKNIPLHVITVDQQFLSALNIGWKYAPLNGSRLTNRPGYTILNETAAQEMGLSGNPVGRPLPVNLSGDPKVDGVVRNFSLGSLRTDVSPLMITVTGDTSRSFREGCYAYIRFTPQQSVSEKIAAIREVYDRYQQEVPFSYYFLDEAYDRLYRTEIRLGRLFSLFTSLTMLVACLGLLGLIIFTVESRTKEIGIRKVMGASVTSIVALLSVDFIRLVLLSVVIASPVAWYVMDRWLQDFANRIDIGWWVFALAGLLATGLAFLTISFQSVKAALTNPVKSLKND